MRRIDGNVGTADAWWPSRYGVADEAGALNEIGADTVVGAAGSVRHGRVYDLAHVLHMGVPAFEGRTFRQELDGTQSVPGPHGLSFVIERVHAPSQMGTHMDALNHLRRDGRTYNGHRVDDPDRYGSGEPGPGTALADWLVDHRVALTGCDTWSDGPVSAEDPERPFVIPQMLNICDGVIVVENLYLSELAGDGVCEFLLVIAHPKLRGTTGVWVAPLAIT